MSSQSFEENQPLRPRHVQEEYRGQLQLIPQHLWNERMEDYWDDTVKWDRNSDTQYLKNFKVETVQKLVFERSRRSIEIDGKSTEIDGLLTVTFTNNADDHTVGDRCRDLDKIFHTSSIFGKQTPKQDELCKAMYHKSTWENVLKIRLEPKDSSNETWEFSFLIQEYLLRSPGKYCPRFFQVPTCFKDDLARQFVNELNLRHTVVKGVDEFSV